MEITTRAVFTPTDKARLTFVERTSINDILVDAIRTPGMQIVVYGHTGSGKSTLLINILERTSENVITTRCMKGMKLDDLIIEAFDQLEPFYKSEKKISKNLSFSPRIIDSFISLKGILESSLTESRVLPPQLTIQRLIQYFGVLNSIWVIEDFHKIAETEKTKLSQMMKVFMDEAERYPHTKVIAVGAVNTAREIVECDHEMQDRISEILVPLMSDKEIIQIINKGESLLNLKISKSLKSEITKFSCGIASVCHYLALQMCLAANIETAMIDQTKINRKHLDKAIENYIKTKSDTLKARFEKALYQSRKQNFDNGGLIVRAILRINKDNFHRFEILKEIQKNAPKYPPGNLTRYLREMVAIERGEILKYDPNTNSYSFNNPFYRSFAQFLYPNETGEEEDQNKEKSNIISEILGEFFAVTLDHYRKSKRFLKVMEDNGQLSLFDSSEENKDNLL